MRLYKLELNNIRNFFDKTEFDFSKSQDINTVSGVNGSGKSTIFKSIAVCQKAYFLGLIKAHTSITDEEHEEIINSFLHELSKYFNDVGSYIKITFNHAKTSEDIILSSLKIFCNTYGKDRVNWGWELDDESEKLISENWNLSNPKNIIVYIDSDKHFREEDVLHSNISIPSQSYYSELVVRLILNPENLFANIYQSLIKDYLRERLVPGKPRKDIYFTITKAIIGSLLPKLELSNFSGLHYSDQFILLGKNNSKKNKKANFYDIRNLSSGEKVLFYSILFINYIPKINLLIIDEPENHFHEELLVKFVKMLSEICASNKYSEYLVSTVGKSIKGQERYIEKIYENHNLSQVYLLTHSKNLIYNNFTNGLNYYIDNKFDILDFDSFENVLRTIGLSSIYSKVLFVEGSKEVSVLSSFFNEHNIKIQGLGGCSQVIDTYSRLLDIKPYLYNYHFCFLIDKDTRNNTKTLKIRERDTAFFDTHFVVLDRHELENFLLDESLFESVISDNQKLDPDIKLLSKKEIRDDMFSIATSDRNRVFQKSLMELNDLSITELKPELVKKSTSFNNEATYKHEIKNLIIASDPSKFLLDKFVENFKSIEAMYSAQNWNADWKYICDGKSVYEAILKKYSIHLGLQRGTLERQIVNKIKKLRTFDINIQIDNLLKKFK